MIRCLPLKSRQPLAAWPASEASDVRSQPKNAGAARMASAKVRRFLVYARDLAMVARLDAGDSQRVVGRAFNVSQRTARNARARLALPRRAPRGLAR